MYVKEYVVSEITVVVTPKGTVGMTTASVEELLVVVDIGMTAALVEELLVVDVVVLLVKKGTVCLGLNRSGSPGRAKTGTRDTSRARLARPAKLEDIILKMLNNKCKVP
jgi:hypothetical protein